MQGSAARPALQRGMGIGLTPYRFVALAVAAVGLLGIAASVGSYEASPIVPVIAVLALAVAVMVIFRPMLGIYAAILAVPLEFATTRFGSSFSLSPTKALILLTGVAVALRLLAARTRPELHPAHLAFLGLLAVVALGITVASSALITERILTVWAGVWLASVWVARADREQVVRVMMCIAISGAVLGMVALAGAGPQALQQGGATATGRASGSFTHPNQLGGYIVLALPLTIILVSERRGWMRPMLLLATAVEVAGLTLTLGRSAIFGGIAAAMVLLAWPGYRRIVLSALAVVAIVLVATPKTLESGQIQVVITRLGTVENFSESTGGRLEVWSGTPRIIADHPVIGIGAGNFAIASQTYGILDLGALPFDHAHNVLLTIAAETGLLGLAFFVWFCASVARAGFRAFRSRDPGISKLALALLASYVGMAVISITDDILTEQAVFAVTMIEAALLIALWRMSRGARTLRRGSRVGGSWWRGAALAPVARTGAGGRGGGP